MNKYAYVLVSLIASFGAIVSPASAADNRLMCWNKAKETCKNHPEGSGAYRICFNREYNNCLKNNQD
ncbi:MULTISPECIES: hypothetical protein [Ochrobactrum]|uniref:hypothetical protein n=1 Tax=Ochrobactrum TaxID=528 RepID=UPI0011C3DC57|nr:hypothetical protein [[Ochrobactrum] soli]MCI0999552.1 hypothetical protein [Ochrobactrum sp. C6C9]